MRMSEIQNDANMLQELIDKNNRIVFFGGAGVSTESGIPDFRSKDGLYHQHYQYDPEVILSHSFFRLYPEEFFRFYKDKMLLLDKKPNAAHQYLAKLEKAGKLDAVITQNIDGLHQLAGSKKVIELHGSIHRNHCMDCHEQYSAQFVLDSPGIIPRCPLCGGVIKPDVVLYEEALDENVITDAIMKISNADLLIVAGTSLVVYPACGFINYFQGDNMVLINKEPSGADQHAKIVIHQKVGELFQRLHI